MIYVVQPDGSVVGFEKGSWLHNTLKAQPKATRPVFLTSPPKSK